MAASLRVLIAGETWVSYGTHIKGFSAFYTGSYAEGLGELVAALRAGGCAVTHIPNHLATQQFPWTMDELDRFDVVVLSDIGSDTLLLHPDTFERGQRTTDRLRLLRDYVAAGRGVLMVGGYMSFSGIEGKARYHATALAEALPIRMLGHDDRVERPEGVVPSVSREHPILDGLPSPWPYFLGYNRLVARPEAETLLSVGDDPFLIVWQFGEGRAAAFASDCSPHWGSPEFLAWAGYGPFWLRLLGWVAGR
jgi:uncharacterized membrane protein